MNVNYDKETITFDFNSFKDFNEINWIKEINKYNSNYLSQHEAISEEAFLDENGQDTRMIRIFKGLKKNIQIKARRFNRNIYIRFACRSIITIIKRERI